MAKGTTQCDRLLSYLETHPGITPMGAWNELGIYRLAARISDLRKRGVNIAKQMVKVQNRFGETCEVARYSLDYTLTKEQFYDFLRSGNHPASSQYRSEA